MSFLLKSRLLRLDPVRGTLAFAVLFFTLRLATDWLFRWTIAGNPAPPAWTVVVTIGFGTVLASTAVFLLLSLMKAQREGLEQLNHQMRNSMQVLAYAIQQCDGETAPKAQAAIRDMSDTLRAVSKRLGMESAERLTPKKN